VVATASDLGCVSVAARLEVRGKDKATLRRWVRSTAIPAGLARRARIVLLAGEGVPNTEIARRVGVSRPTVIGWRERYLEGGTAALDDRPRPGRAKQVDEAAVVVAALEKPPSRLGVTHWSCRLLGRELGLGHATIARVWAKWDLQPWRVETFKFSTDPELEAKVRDVSGSICIRPRTRWYSASMRSRRSRPWTGPSPRCRWAWAAPSSRPTTTSATAPPRCSLRWTWPPVRSLTPATRGIATRSSSSSNHTDARWVLL